MGRCIASDAVQELQTTVSHCSMRRRPAITHSQTHFVCLDSGIFNDVNRRFFSPVLQYLFARHHALSHYLQEYEEMSNSLVSVEDMCVRVTL